MSNKLRVLAITKDKATEITLIGLTPIGGKRGTGIIIDGLKHEGDYGVLAHVGNTVSIHPLRSTKAKPASLQVGQVFQIEDLVILVEEPRTQGSISDTTEFEMLRKVLLGMTKEGNTKKPLQEILNSIIQLCGHHQGLVISQTLNGSYEILAAEKLDSSRPWLSENLVQHAIKTKEPVILQNVIGSGFDTRQSLMATNFLSVFCWPLVVQGSTVGVLVTGSQFPYSGTFESIRSRAEVFISLAALILDFHLRELRLKNELDTFRDRASDSPFLTESVEVNEVFELARKISNSDLATLVQGETGVGKEVLSRWIHQQSDRKNKPFVAVNCAAIPSELLESALFGHKRGSFTGAVTDHVGKIQQAHGGTLFLDEIGDLPLLLQTKLLRVLQDRIVEPVGSNKSIDVDIRLICATHKDVAQMSQQGLFRQDLYYRIAQITLFIPPLRERLGDVRLLTLQFLKEINPNKHLTQDAWSWLLSQAWPGNIRELKTAVKRAAILSGNEDIQAKHFSAGSGTMQARGKNESGIGKDELRWLGASDLEAAKHAFVMQKIDQALQITGGNRTKAAELLGVTSRTLFRYLEQKTMSEMS